MHHVPTPKVKAPVESSPKAQAQKKPLNFDDEQKPTCFEKLKSNHFIFPVIIAVLVVAVAVITIVLMAVNTDKSVGSVVNSLQDQILDIGESRFELLLRSVIEITRGTAKSLSRLNLPPMTSNNSDIFEVGSPYQAAYAVLDKTVNDYDDVNVSWMVFANGRGITATYVNTTVTTVGIEVGNSTLSQGLYSFVYPSYNFSSLVDGRLNYSRRIGFVPGFKGYLRPQFQMMDPSDKTLQAKFFGPYAVANCEGCLFVSVFMSVWNNDGSWLGLVASNVALNVLTRAFQKMSPTPNTIVFLTDTLGNVVASSKGPLLTWDGKQFPLQKSNETVLRAASFAVNNNWRIAQLTRVKFEAPDGNMWRLTAKPFNKYGTNFVLATVTPDNEFTADVEKATRDTIIICSAIAVVVFICILIMMNQQHRLILASKQSVIVAQQVANQLLWYDTEEAEKTLEASVLPIFVDPESGNESDNYVNRQLVSSLSKINAQMAEYKPFIPSYLLPNSNTGLDEHDLENADADASGAELKDDDSNAGGGTGHNDSKILSKRGTADHMNDSKEESTRHKSSTHYGNDADADPNNPYFVKMSKNSRGSHGSRGAETSTTAKTDGRAAMAKIALLKNVGEHVDRLVIANLNLSRAIDIMFNVSRNVKATSVMYVNKMIEHVLDTSFANDGSVHALIGDSCIVSFGATHRTAHVDVKCMRFCTTLETNIKKDITTWSGSNNNNNNALIDFITHRPLLSGGVVNGSGWCQMGGSKTRQHFMLANFSNTELFNAVVELGERCKFIACDRTVFQNTQHEFLMRGASLHVLPGFEHLLFGSATTENASRVGGEYSTLPHSAETAATTPGAANQQQQQTTSSLNNNNGVNKLIGNPIYELVCRKNLGAQDEWMYALQEGDKNAGGNSTNKKNPMSKHFATASFFNDAIMDCCRAKGDSALEILRTKIAASTEDPEVTALPAYINLENLINRIRAAQK